MKDLLNVFKSAKAKRIYASDQEFRLVLTSLLDADRKLHLAWDDGAGEEWAMLNHPSGDTMMLNRRIGLAFVTNGYDPSSVSRILDDLFIETAERYSADEWCIDPEQLRTEVPEICWHADCDAVRTDSFSLAELYYATV